GDGDSGDGDGDGDGDSGDGDGDGDSGDGDGDGDQHCIDADDDGFGDPTMCSDTPLPGTVPNDGDCDDDDDTTVHGAAEDDWGDPNPEGSLGPWVGGGDCWAANEDLNPDTVRLATFVEALALLDNQYLGIVDANTAEITEFHDHQDVGFWRVITAALGQDGTI